MRTLYSLHYKIQFPGSILASLFSSSPPTHFLLTIVDRFTHQSLGAIELYPRRENSIHMSPPYELSHFNLQEILLAFSQCYFEANPVDSIAIEAISELKAAERDLIHLGFFLHRSNRFILSRKALFESSAARRRRVDVAVGVLVDRQGQIMMGLCAPSKPLAGLWEFPGGKVETGESPLAAVERELQEELGIDIEPRSVRFLGDFLYIYPHLCVRLFFYLAPDWEGIPHSQEHQDLVWVYPSQAYDYPIPPSTLHLLNILKPQ